MSKITTMIQHVLDKSLNEYIELISKRYNINIIELKTAMNEISSDLFSTTLSSVSVPQVSVSITPSFNPVTTQQQPSSFLLPKIVSPTTSNETQPQTSKNSKSTGVRGLCTHIFTRTGKAGQLCGKKSMTGSDRCCTHNKSKGDKTTSKSVKASSLSATIEETNNNNDEENITPKRVNNANSYSSSPKLINGKPAWTFNTAINNPWNSDTRLVLDNKDKHVFATYIYEQLNPLTEKDIETCKKHGFNYKIVKDVSATILENETISSPDIQQTVEPVESVESKKSVSSKSIPQPVTKKPISSSLSLIKNTGTKKTGIKRQADNEVDTNHSSPNKKIRPSMPSIPTSISINKNDKEKEKKNSITQINKYAKNVEDVIDEMLTNKNTEEDEEDEFIDDEETFNNGFVNEDDENEDEDEENIEHCLEEENIDIDNEDGDGDGDGLDFEEEEEELLEEED